MNYEGGEAIGLFANETQMASYATDKLGLDWKNLDEAGKQVTRLEYAKSMQESAGATGQAARESNSLENQLGNLKQAWEDIKAKFGAPILEPAVNGIKKLADLIVNFDTKPIIEKFDKFVSYISSNITPAFNAILPVATSAFEKIKSVASGFVDFFKNLFTGEGNVGESFVRVFNSIKEVAIPILQDAVTFIKGILDQLKQFWDENGAQITEAVKNAFSMIASIIEFVMPYVQMYIEKIWGVIKAVFQGAVDVILGIIKVFSGLFTGDWSKLWEGIKQIVSGIATAIWGIVKNSFLGNLITAFIEFKNKVVAKFNELKDNAISKFNELKSKATEKFNEIKNAIMGPINTARDKVGEAISKIKGFFSGLSLKLPNISTPHFKLKNWSKNPLDWVDKMPSIGVDWYAKGAIFTQPTLFNTPGGIKGFGEAGPEAAIPLTESVLGAIGKMIASTMPQSNGNISLNIQPAPVYLDGYEITKIIFDYIDDKQQSELAGALTLNGVKL